jgi:hypothetical protein
MEHCHCGAMMRGSDHCPECGCEQFEAVCSHVAAGKVKVYRRHDDAHGVTLCEAHAPLLLGRPGIAAHLSLCAMCAPLAMPGSAVCEQCARCGTTSRALSVYLLAA